MINRPCTLVQRGADTYDENLDPDGSDTTVETFCELQTMPRPTLLTETEEGNIGIDTLRVYLLGDVIPQNYDALVIDSETYEFTGDPISRRSPVDGQAVYTVGYVRRRQ